MKIIRAFNFSIQLSLLFSSVNAHELNNFYIKRDLFLAIASQDINHIEEICIRNNTNINTHDSTGQTPLHYALKLHPYNKNLIDTLIHCGANINKSDLNGIRPSDIIINPQEQTEKFTISVSKDQNNIALDGAIELGNLETNYNHCPDDFYPADISFCIVDLKFGPDGIKICEFGEGTCSGFTGYHKLFSYGSMIGMFWNYLFRFKIPVWYVKNSVMKSPRLKNFVKNGGRFIKNLKNLELNPLFQKSILAKKTHVNFRSIRNYAAIVVTEMPNRISEQLQAFKQKYPNILILDAATCKHVTNKLLTHMLFTGDHEIEHARPICKIYPKHYSPALVSSIYQEFPGDKLVLKLVNRSHGNGVIIIDKQNIDTTLQTLLTNCKPKKIPNALKEALFCWRNDSHPVFIVEQCEPSKLIHVKEKKYDATMRVAFAVHYDQGEIVVTFFDGYWKLPLKSVSERGSLLEKYKSQIDDRKRCSARVKNQDMNIIQQQLEPVIKRFYAKLLKIKQKTDPFPLSNLSEGSNK